MKSLVMTSSVFVLLCLVGCITALQTTTPKTTTDRGNTETNQHHKELEDIRDDLREIRNKTEEKLRSLDNEVKTIREKVTSMEKVIAEIKEKNENETEQLRKIIEDIRKELQQIKNKTEENINSIRELMQTVRKNITDIGKDIVKMKEAGADIEFTSTSKTIHRLNTKEIMRCRVRNNRHGVPEDLANVTSIVISHNGVEIAKVTQNNTARSVGDSSVLDVSGSLTENLEDLGFLELKPTDGGNYRCDVMVKNTLGNAIQLLRELKLETVNETNSDIVDWILAQRKQSSNNIPDVFFSAAFTNSKNNIIPSGKVLIFNQVFSSMGGGYDNTTGVFTCPFAGFYNFIVHAQTEYTKAVFFHLQHNGRDVFSVTSQHGYAYQDVSNSAVLQLQKGDTVGVVSYDNDTEVHSSVKSVTTTFSGILIAAE